MKIVKTIKNQRNTCKSKGKTQRYEFKNRTFEQGEIVILHNSNKKEGEPRCDENSSLLSLKNGRPAVVISNNRLAKCASKLIVIKLTHNLKPFPSHHVIYQNGDISAAVGEEPITVDKSTVTKTHMHISKTDLIEILCRLMWAVMPELVKNNEGEKISKIP